MRPPQSIKKEYEDQTPAKYVFKCKDGEIQISEYGISRSEFYFQEWVDRRALNQAVMYDSI